MLGSVGIRAPEKPPLLSNHMIAARTCEPFRFPARGLGGRRSMLNFLDALKKLQNPKNSKLQIKKNQKSKNSQTPKLRRSQIPKLQKSKILRH